MDWGGREPPAERLVDAVFQLVAARQLGFVAAAGDIPALEPAEPRAAAPQPLGQRCEAAVA
jgi:hypothetical protein